MGQGLQYGSEQKGYDAMHAMGFSPKFALKWIGSWTLRNIRADGSCPELDDFLSWCKQRGATPVVLFYYWGDGITDSVLLQGGNGKSQADWKKLGDMIGRRFQAAAIPGYVVVENEFNKTGVTPSVIDPLLRDMATRIKGHAPASVRIVSGTGSWASPSIYDRYPGVLATSDVLGTQLMRGLTKDSRQKYEASAEYITSWLEEVARRYGKPQLVFDATFSTYGAGEAYMAYPWPAGTPPAQIAPPASSTEEALAAGVTRGLKEREARLVAANVLGFVFREPRDSVGRVAEKNYFGAAEYYMGWAERTDGSKKQALLEAMRDFMTPTPSAPPPLAVTVQASLARTSFEQGQDVAGVVAVTANRDLRLKRVVLAARPPGGTNAGGPYRDVGSQADVVLKAGEAQSFPFARRLGETDPTGEWYAYGTIQHEDGSYQDAPERLTFTVKASPPDPLAILQGQLDAANAAIREHAQTISVLKAQILSAQEDAAALRQKVAAFLSATDALRGA